MKLNQELLFTCSVCGYIAQDSGLFILDDVCAKCWGSKDYEDKKIR